jgi:hypothetical protein
MLAVTEMHSSGASVFGWPLEVSMLARTLANAGFHSSHRFSAKQEPFVLMCLPWLVVPTAVGGSGTSLLALRTPPRGAL